MFDIRKADAAYETFPNITDWSELTVDTIRWGNQIKKIKKIRTDSPIILLQAQNIVRRYAAIETGAIEKLYSVERGFTWTIAVESAEMQGILIKKGTKVKNLIEAQLDGYDYILDLTTNKRKITEKWIRELHSVICKAQKTYSVLTENGPQERELPLGVYKRHPNHVMKADGLVYSYCPVDMVGAEMNRLIKILNSDNFINLHPVIQASFAHYALVKIHPFSDGNGRIARAIASIYLYRSVSIPLLILSDDRDEYLDALENADEKNLQILVNFVLERSLSAIDTVIISLRASVKSPAKNSMRKLKEFYITKGGFTHEEVDSAAEILFKSYEKIQALAFKEINDEKLLQHFSIGSHKNLYPLISSEYRQFLNNRGMTLVISMNSKPPANASVKSEIEIHIPKDCGKWDDFILKNKTTGESVTARVSEIIPSFKSSLVIKLEIFSELNMNEIYDRLFNSAKEVYRR